MKPPQLTERRREVLIAVASGELESAIRRTTYWRRGYRQPAPYDAGISKYKLAGVDVSEIVKALSRARYIRSYPALRLTPQGADYLYGHATYPRHGLTPPPET